MRQIAVTFLGLALLLSLAGCQLEPKTPKYIEDGLKAEEELPVNDSEMEEDTEEPTLESEADDDASTEPQELPEDDEVELEVKLESETSVEAE